CDAVVLAGRVRRPDFASLKPDMKGAALLPKIIAAAAKGDGALLSLVVETLEAEGVKVLAPETVLGDLAAPGGALGAFAPSAEDRADIAKAARLVAALGPFDVGQAAVVARGFVLAVEAAEGTDAMLDRCALLPGRGSERSGVLLKRPKPQQERRIDLPVVGAETMRRAAAAGLAGVAVEAGGALVVDRAATLAAADSLRLFVYGFSPSEVD
ncbi:MAG: UDP-2,3-diacylglucosamine diphosphatase LpxI, partial [Parvularculaceae bacterium]|nr:UDP-2,3-diacylglucosamine diphosphatase LpxI [Parvularculaceae bacterium]